MAFEVLGQTQDPAKAVRCLSSLAKATGGEGLVGGEIMDVEGEGSDADIEFVETIHRRKTGALVASCCEMGAIMGGASPDVSDSLSKFGLELGFAFQVVDDILNETSSMEKLGKAAGSDKDRMKLTFPSLIGLEASSEVARCALNRALKVLDGLSGDVAPLREIAVSCVERDS